MILNPQCVLRKKENIYFVLNYENQSLFEINKRCFLLLKLFENDCIEIPFKEIRTYKGLKTLSKKDYLEFIELCKEKKILINKENYEINLNKRKTITNLFMNNISNFAQTKTLPIKLEIELTGKCNYSCLHCAVEKKDINLDPLIVCDFLQKMKELGCSILNLTGGEILLYKDLKLILDCANKFDYCVNILSNASLFNKEIINEIFSYKCINSLQTSIYSLNTQIYDKIVCSKNYLPKVIENLKYIKQKGVKIDVSFVLMKYNQSEVEDVKNFCEKNGYNFKPVPVLFACKNHNRSPLKLRPCKEDLKKIITKNNLKNISNPKTNYICNAGRDRLAVDYNGNIFPCAIFPKKIGNITEDIGKIWKNNSLLKKLRHLKIDCIPQCKNCPKSAYCELCPGVFFINNKDMLLPDEYSCIMADISKS